MRVLSTISHDDHDLGTEYELAGERLERLLTAGVVVPASEWRYTYHPPQSAEGDQRHAFTRVAPAPVVETAPVPDTPAGAPLATETAPAPLAPAAPSLETR